MKSYALSSSRLAAWREEYRAAMGCQVVHDSLHQRPGWTQSRAFEIDGREAGYFSIVQGGPWAGERTLFEVYWRQWPADRMDASTVDGIVRESGASFVLAQSNDRWTSQVLKRATSASETQAVLFGDRGVGHAVEPLSGLNGSDEPATFRERRDFDVEALVEAGLDAGAEWVLELRGSPIAAGGVLTHYNPPYGDVYMAVAEPHRRRGHGTFLVQRLIEVARERGLVPAARCRPDNEASIRTLQRAGLVRCGEISRGVVTIR